jgi:hypothetical protein
LSSENLPQDGRHEEEREEELCKQTGEDGREEEDSFDTDLTHGIRPVPIHIAPLRYISNVGGMSSVQ